MEGKEIQWIQGGKKGWNGMLAKLEKCIV